MVADVVQPGRAHLVRKHDHLRHPKLSQVLNGSLQWEGGKRRRVPSVAWGGEARVAVEDRLPEAGRGEHAVDILEQLTRPREREAGDDLVPVRLHLIEHWRDPRERT